MANHSSILAWRIPWTEEPGLLCIQRSQRVRHDGRDLHAHIEVGENQLNHQKGAPREKVHRPTTEVSAAFHLPGTLSLSNSKL